MKLFISLLLALPALAQTEWTVVKTFPIGGQGAWDYLTVDPASHRLFVPRTTHTMVIDGETGKTLADIPGQINAHGVAIAPASGRGFISDGGGDGAIVVFDLKTYQVLGHLAALPDADGIIFDAHSGKVLVVSGRGKAFLSFDPDIDVKSGKMDAPVALHGEPEFLAADAGGRVYINLMDTNEVAVVDLKTRKVLANWPVLPGGQPVGMAIDEAAGRIFIGCRGPQKLISMSTKDGRVLGDIPIGPGVDAVKVEDGQVFAGTAGSQLFVGSAGQMKIDQTVKTAEGARTMGIDPTTHRIYLPAAEYDTDAKGKRAQKPGSFMIVVVGRKEADVSGRWTGTADTTDEAGTKRQEKQTFEFKSEGGKLTGFRVNRAGTGGSQVGVQRDGAKFNVYEFLDFEGGEHLRWKVELKNGNLVGTFSALHDNPHKWIYDRIGPMTLTRVAK
jgi:YVTN family beta-propeller protein